MVVAEQSNILLRGLMSVMLLGGIFLKTYERGLLGNVAQTYKKHNLNKTRYISGS